MEKNLTTIKNYIYDEVNRYYTAKDEMKIIESDILILSNIMVLIKSKNYAELYDRRLEILILLETFLPAIYKKKIYAFIDCFAAFYDNSNGKRIKPDYLKRCRVIYKNFIPMVEKYIEGLEEKLEKTKPALTAEEVRGYNQITYNLKNNILIDSSQYVLLEKLYKMLGLDDKTCIILTEKIRNYNTTINLTNRNIRVDYARQNLIHDIINMGYEKLEIPYIEKQRIGYLNNQVDYLYKLFCEVSGNEMIDYLPMVENYSKEEFKYILFKLLKRYQDEMLVSAEFISTQEGYSDREIRRDCVLQFRTSIYRYKLIRNYYDKEILKYGKKDDTQREKVNELYYLMHGTTDSKETYVESDIKDLPKDLMKSLIRLIKSFEENTLGQKESKMLGDQYSGLRELKDDQLRVFYRHLSDNRYVIVGVAVKKADTDYTIYDRMFTRKITPDDISNDEEVVKKLFDVLEKNQFTGGRKNA